MTSDSAIDGDTVRRNCRMILSILENWYKFEAETTEKALREWCAENDIQIVKGSASSTA